METSKDMARRMSNDFFMNVFMRGFLSFSMSDLDEKLDCYS